jgi:putative nucleotidyltransferase with HDIG domain
VPRIEARVLIVDDERPVRALLSTFLRSQGYETVEAANAEEALGAFLSSPFDLVLSDVNMPGKNGLSLLADIRRERPDTAVLMLTGCGDISMAVEAMKSGACDYVLKPFVLDRVATAVEQALERRTRQVEQAGYLRELEATVLKQSEQLRGLLMDLNNASEHTLEALVAALDAREHETKAHSRRVAEYAVRLAAETGMEKQLLEDLRRGALLHDIGKIGLPDRILLKPASLTEAEWTEMRRHPKIGYWILQGIESLRPASEIVVAHHERYDGGGYPDGLAAGAIPLGARIFAIADSMDAITSARPYHKGHSFEAAREEISANAGAQFDPWIVERFLAIPQSVWPEIRERSMRSAAPPPARIPDLVLRSCQQSEY